MNRKRITLEIIGWYGAIAILAAYLFVSIGMIAANGALFQILNLTGGIGLTTIAFIKKDWQLVVVNAVWAVIAVVALVAIYMK